jgi:hypothetical protein
MDVVEDVEEAPGVDKAEGLGLDILVWKLNNNILMRRD